VTPILWIPFREIFALSREWQTKCTWFWVVKRKIKPNLVYTNCNHLSQVWTCPGRQGAVANIFCAVAPKVCRLLLGSRLSFIFSSLQFWSGFKVFGKFVHPWLKRFILKLHSILPLWRNTLFTSALYFVIASIEFYVKEVSLAGLILWSSRFGTHLLLTFLIR